MRDLAGHFQLGDQKEKLYAALGQGNLSVGQVMGRLFPEEDKQKSRRGHAFDRIIDKIRKDATGIRLQGIGNLMVSYAKCCQPVPGDKVVGYVTRGRGVSIHRMDCPNLLRMALDPDRRVEVDWKAIGDEEFLVRILVTGSDRKGMLADLTTAITEAETNIRSAELTSREFEFSAFFVVEVKDLKQLKKIISSLNRIRGVEMVKRREYFSPKAIEKKSLSPPVDI